MSTIQIDGLTGAIDEIMEDLKREANRANEETVNEISKESLKIVKANAPMSNTKRRGTYKKSLARKKTGGRSGEVGYRIYSKDQYQLTHLLEHGHQLRSGGRTRAFPHFKLGEDYAKEKIEAEFKKNFKP